MEAEETLAEAKVAIERERTFHAKLTEQTTINQNLQNDLRLLYLKHKKDLAELQGQYQHEQYKTRYADAVQERNVAQKKLAALTKIMEETATIRSKSGLLEAMKENVNTMNQTAHVMTAKTDDLRAFQANYLKAFADKKQLVCQLRQQKTITQKLMDEKAAQELTWNVRRSEWESLCEKIALERDALKNDNHRASGVSERLEGTLSITSHLTVY